MSSRVDDLLGIAAQISAGQVPLHQYDECFSTGAFDQLLAGVVGAEAFALLEAVCGQYDSIAIPGADLAGYFALLEQLARLSGTTEMPTGLEAIITRHPAMGRGLDGWYRRNE